jgi:LuxR family maltose regulon positive regulatory protein
LTLYQIDGMAVLRGHSLLLLALVRHGRGEFAGARKLVDEARELAGRCTDPGMLPSLLEQVTRALSIAPGRQAQIAAPLTERELAVLRLLATQLSTREIARELSVSVNTIRSQVQAIYRKLVATSRAEAVTSARQLKLLR